MITHIGVMLTPGVRKLLYLTLTLDNPHELFMYYDIWRGLEPVILE